MIAVHMYSRTVPAPQARIPLESLLARIFHAFARDRPRADWEEAGRARQLLRGQGREKGCISHRHREGVKACSDRI